MIEQLIKAWTDPGPVPEYHRKMQDKLRREWPTLAVAIENMVELYEN